MTPGERYRQVLLIALTVAVMPQALRAQSGVGGFAYDRFCKSEFRPDRGSWAAPPNTTVRNRFGPQIGDAAGACPGACGPGCAPNNCEEGVYWECVDTKRFRVVRTYECHTHEGCREHDDCLDECARRYPGTGRVPTFDTIGEHLADWRPERNFYLSECSSCCHIEAWRDYGWDDGGEKWKDGYESETHPPDGYTTFEYTKDYPSAEDAVYRCPKGMHLVCENGIARCDEEEGEPEDEPEDDPASIVVGVVIAAPGICNDPDLPLPLSATVIGLASPNVTWTILSGPGRIDAGSGRLTPQGEGNVVVEAASVSDPLYRDRAMVDFGHCDCSFSALLSGDTRRFHVEGDWAVFSTRGQAGLMGGMGGRITVEAREDLLNAMKMAQGIQGLIGGGGVSDEMQEQLVGVLQRDIDEQRKQGDGSSGSSLSVSVVESGDGRPGPHSAGGLGTAFKLDAFSEQGIEPGYTGEVPLDMLAFHTGEFASEGLGPMFYRWDSDTEGQAQIFVTSYDGRWMRGTVTAHLPAVPGLMKLDGGKPWVRVSVDFMAGLFNPLRMENVCLMATAFGE